MAVRKVLVVKNGQVQQLQPGDIISGQNLSVDLTNGSGTDAAPIGSPVRILNDDTFSLAEADNANAKDTIGFAAETIGVNPASGTIQTEGVLEATTGEWDAITGDTGGLVAGSKYYLDVTPGKMTKTPPTAEDVYLAPLGIAITATTFRIDIDTNILL